MKFTKEFIEKQRKTGTMSKASLADKYNKALDHIERQAERIEELEHYKRLNDEWVKERVEGLNTFEEIERMVELAEKLGRKYAKEWIHCGWCKEKFETREEVKEHLLICKSNPLNKYIQRYENLITNLFVFLERDRLVRAHASQMSEFIKEYRDIKADIPQPPQEES